MSATTAAAFRAGFPEFANPNTYPDSEIDWWAALGARLHSPDRWGNLLDFGVQLFVAHNLALGIEAKRAGARGQNPGAIVGVLTSGSVDKVSYSRDASAAMDPANGHWNLTTYGLRHVALVRIVGAGPVQVGVPSGAAGEPYGAWPGPFNGGSIIPGG